MPTNKKKKQLPGYSTGGILGNVAAGAGTGALAGSVVPGWGTAIGAVAGGISGLIQGLNTDKQEKALLAQQQPNLVDMERLRMNSIQGLKRFQLGGAINQIDGQSHQGADGGRDPGADLRVEGGAVPPSIPERHHGSGKPQASYGNPPGYRPDEDNSSRA